MSVCTRICTSIGVCAGRRFTAESRRAAIRPAITRAQNVDPQYSDSSMSGGPLVRAVQVW
jgi:hypothetical protein